MLSDELDLLVLGGLGVDIAAQVSALPLPIADSVTAPVDLRIGNTGAGVALAARAIGLSVAVVDTLGADPPADIVRAAMSRAGIDTVVFPDPRGTRRSVSLIEPGGRRMALYDPRGPWTGPPPLDEPTLRKLAGGARHVHVSIMDWMIGLLPSLPTVDRPVSTDLHDWDGANAYHAPFAAAADLVFVSGTQLPNVDATLAAILSLGRASLAVATLGERGARILGGGAELAAQATTVPAEVPPSPVIDSNGAGDAFAAGFLAGQLRGWPPAECARYAAAVAAAACTYRGMEYPPGLLPRP